MNTHLLHKHFSEWFELYAEPLYRHAYLRIHDRDRAADLMQETFTRAWSYVARGNEIREPRAFLYKTLNNLVVNEYERRRPTSSLEVMDEETGYEPAAGGDDHGQASARIDAGIILEKLGSVNEEYREVLVMRYIDELQVSEIAVILQESENTVSVRIHRALKKMRQLVDENEKHDV